MGFVSRWVGGLALALVGWGNVQATNIGGTLGGNTTLDLAGSPWHVTSTLTVPAGITLSVDPGVEVIFDGNYIVQVNGALSAVGNAGSPITFRGPGSGAGQWQYIRFNNNLAASNLSYVNVLHGSSSLYASSAVTLDHCTVTLGSSHGAYISTSQPVALNQCVFQQCGTGLYLYNGPVAATDVTISGAATGVTLNGGSLEATDLTISGGTYPMEWNSAASSLALHGSTTFSGQSSPQIRCSWGATLSANLQLPAVPVAYHLAGSVTVPAGRSLVLDPGVCLKLANDVGITVAGSFQSNGTEALPNTITSIKDDNVLGDSNGDGAATSPAAGNWTSLTFQDGSLDASCALSHTTVRYGSSSLLLQSAAPSLDHCSFSLSHYPLHLTGTASPSISYCTFAVATYTPLYMSMSANPLMTDNVFSTSNNGSDAIGLIPESLSADGHLIQRDFTSVPNVTYLLSGTVTVPAGRTLTIDPGVVLKFASSSIGINVQGSLVAPGTTAEPVTLTSLHDDLYGNPADTNHNGSSTSPAAGQWRGLYLNGGTADLAHLNLRYAGGNGNISIEGAYRYAAAILHNATGSFDQVDFFVNGEHGLLVAGNSAPLVDSCSFANHTVTPICLSVASSPSFSNLSFSNNAHTALGLMGESVGTSCTLAPRNVAGHSNICYVLEGNLVLESGSTLTIAPGVVVKGVSGARLTIEGGLLAESTAGQEIVFTSTHDDTAGQPLDTNNNGNSSSPAVAQWYGLLFNSSADDAQCRLEHVEIRYAYQAAVECQSAAPQLRACRLAACYHGVSAQGNSAPLLEGCLIESCTYAPVTMSVLANPDLAWDNNFVNNGYLALLITNETLSQPATLARRDVAGVLNMPYLIQGYYSRYTIAAAGRLTLEPGVVIKFAHNNWNEHGGGIDVYGGLECLGTAAEPVVLTSRRDDSVGGDTNGDGSGSSPASSNWWGITFYASADDAHCRLEHTQLRYAGTALSCTDASPTVEHCEISNVSSGLDLTGLSNPLVQHNVWVNLSSYPVYMSLLANPQFADNQLYNVAVGAIALKSETIGSEVELAPRDFGGYSNITYLMTGAWTINAGARLRILPGVVLKCASSISVNGSLEVDGAILTVPNDDSVGNPADTYFNGSAPPYLNPAAGQWTGVYFASVSDDASCRLSDSEVRYASYGVQCSQSSPLLERVNLLSNSYGLALVGGNAPVRCTDVLIDHSATCAVLQTLITDADFSGVTFGAHNRWNGLEIFAETLAQNATIRRESAANIDNLVWLLASNLSVGTSSVLSIEPGVVLKSSSGTISVSKGLQALGGPEPEQQIVFTDIEDDFYGGDTNNDGDATAPASSYFTLRFLNESWDGLCNLEHCVFAYAGYVNYYGAVDAASASPSLRHCSFRNGSLGLRATGNALPVVEACEFVDNTWEGIYSSNNLAAISAENCWWGDPSGPLDASNDTGSGGWYNPLGMGDLVSNNVDYSPWSGSLLHPRLGDVSRNGTVQAYDAALILAWLADSLAAPLDSAQVLLADVTREGGVNAVDAHYILQWVVGNIPALPGELDGYPGEEFDPASQLALAVEELEDGEAWLSWSVEGDNLWRGCQLEASFPQGAVEILAVESASAQPMSFDWGAAEGNLRVALAAVQASQTEAPVVRVRVRGDWRSVAATRFWVNDQRFELQESAVEVEQPLAFRLHPAAPNPFNPSTRIVLDLAEPEALTVRIHNLAGQLVRELGSGPHAAGQHTLVWNGETQAGTQAASGVYVLSVEGPRHRVAQRLTLLK